MGTKASKDCKASMRGTFVLGMCFAQRSNKQDCGAEDEEGNCTS